MYAAGLDDLDHQLGILLPEAYRKVIRRLMRKRLRGARAGLVCMDTSDLLELNELARILGPVAGLKEWPDDLFVIGEDEDHNYYVIRHDTENSSVLCFDPARDELRECAPSIEEFCKRIETSAPFDRKVLRSGRRSKAAVSGAVAVPDFERMPKWATNWPAFVEAYAELDAKNPEKPATKTKLNSVFGSRPVRWTGRVSQLDLGMYPRAWVEMPPAPGLSRFPQLERVSFSLRWAGPRRSRGYFKGKKISPQVLTSISDWRPIRLGDEIEFLMVFAPGIKGQVACVGPVTMESGRIYTTSDCGGHVLRVLDRSRRKTAKK